MSKCKACGADITWMKTEAGKNIPVDTDTVGDFGADVFDKETMTAHWATCPDADKFRRKKNA